MLSCNFGQNQQVNIANIAMTMTKKNPSICVKLFALGALTTEGPLLMLFFETLEKQPCKQKTV